MGNINDAAVNAAIEMEDFLFGSIGGKLLRKVSLSTLLAALKEAGIATEKPTLTKLDLSALNEGVWVEHLSDGSTVNHTITTDANGNVISVDGMTIEWPEVV